MVQVGRKDTEGAPVAAKAHLWDLQWQWSQQRNLGVEPVAALSLFQQWASFWGLIVKLEAKPVQGLVLPEPVQPVDQHGGWVC